MDIIMKNKNQNSKKRERSPPITPISNMKRVSPPKKLQKLKKLLDIPVNNPLDTEYSIQGSIKLFTKMNKFLKISSQLEEFNNSTVDWKKVKTADQGYIKRNAFDMMKLASSITPPKNHHTIENCTKFLYRLYLQNIQQQKQNTIPNVQ
jgi:hypothetical protein